MKIYADIVTQNFLKEDEKLDSYSLKFYFGFRNNGNLPVHLNNANFGYSLSDISEELEKNDSPLNGTPIIMTDQDFIYFKKFENLTPEKEYFLLVWAENNSSRWEEKFTFILPKPDQPFKSWVYDSESQSWQPPIPRPEGDETYIWDEKNKKWEKRSSPVVD